MRGCTSKTHRTLELEQTIYTTGQIQARKEKQIALVGRSNVGKSSLINALACNKNLAKVSKVPGKTRSINLYKVLPDAFYLVDLPGYGYARVSHQEKTQWSRLLTGYLTNTPELSAVLLLIDSRLPPQKIDMEFLDFAKAHQLPVIPVLTKIDKCPQKTSSQCQQLWKNLTGISPLPTSSSSRRGIDSLWQTIANLALPGSPAQELPASS